MDQGALRCIQLNLNGWRSQELDKLLHDEKPDVVMLQETSLKEIKNCSIKGYAVFRQDRITARVGEGASVSGGGLITLIRDDAAAHNKLSIIQLLKLYLGKIMLLKFSKLK